MRSKFRKNQYIALKNREVTDALLVGRIEKTHDGIVRVENLITKELSNRAEKVLKTKFGLIGKPAAENLIVVFQADPENAPAVAEATVKNARKQRQVRAEARARAEAEAQAALVGPASGTPAQEPNGQMIMSTDPPSAVQAKPVPPPQPPLANNPPSMPDAARSVHWRGLHKEKPHNALLFIPIVNSDGSAGTKIIAKALLPRFASDDVPEVLLWQSRCFYRTSKAAVVPYKFVEVYAHTVSPTHVDEDVTSLAIDTEKDLEGGNDES